jgi:urease accessory protein
MHSEREETYLPFLLQQCDSAFPTGGYAHSLGLEEIARLGVVHSEASLAAYIECHLVPALERFELPLLRQAYEAAGTGDMQRLIDLDWELDAWKMPRELREASTRMGRSRLAALDAIRKGTAAGEYRQRILRGEAPGHHLISFALCLNESPWKAVAIAWSYQSIWGCCAAAIKLIRIGQEAAHRVLAGAMSAIKWDSPVSDPEWFDPLAEIASMRHEAATERLFIT